MGRTLLLLIFIALVSVNLASAKDYPRGVYHSGGMHYRSPVDSAVVNGEMLRLKWRDVNPAEDEYAFSVLDRALADAFAINKKVTLAVLDSYNMPDFVLSNCERFNYEFRGRGVETCLPWDSYYLSMKRKLVQALGERYDSNESLAGVYISYSAMSNGIEMHFRVSERLFEGAGYSQHRLLNSYKDVIDIYASAFMQTPLIMEVHKVFGSIDLANDGFKYCHDVTDGNCGAAMWWCAKRMATKSNESEFETYSVIKKASELSFSICQTIGNFSKQHDRFGQYHGAIDAFANEMVFFIDEGVSVFELWTVDIKNEEMMSLLLSSEP